jgi:hypothetical protein
MSKWITQNYKGYEGQLIKQADEFIIYPLNVITDKNRSKRPGICGKNWSQRWASDGLWSAICFISFSDREKAYDYFVKSYRPNSRPPFGVFSESANSNNPISLQVPELCLPSYTVLGRGTDMGLKYNKGLCPSNGNLWKSLD